VLDALELVGRDARHSRLTDDPRGETSARHAGLQGDWSERAYSTDARGRERVVRMIYEIASFQAVRDQLRCKEIWVLGADRWRNPDEDLPADFEQRRAEHYRALRKPVDPSEFIDRVRGRMRAELDALHRALRDLDFLQIADRGKQGSIKLTAQQAHPEPANLKARKQGIRGRWGMVPLIAMLKEAILRTGCHDVVSEMARGARLSEETLAERLMLALVAYGTNTGIRHLSAGDHGHSEDELRESAGGSSPPRSPGHSRSRSPTPPSPPATHTSGADLDDGGLGFQAHRRV